MAYAHHDITRLFLSRYILQQKESEIKEFITLTIPYYDKKTG